MAGRHKESSNSSKGPKTRLQLTMEGKKTTKLVQRLLKVLCRHFWYLQKTVQVETENWQKPEAHVSLETSICTQ